MADRFGHRRTVKLVGLALALSVLSLAGALWFARLSLLEVQAIIVLCHVLTGAFTAATYALFMDITDPALGGTQFSTFMSATNLCEIWAGASTGWLVSHYGYALPFVIMSAVGTLALLFVPQARHLKNCTTKTSPPYSLTPIT